MKKKIYRLQKRAEGFIQAWISARFNAWQLWKALRVCKSLCLSDQRRWCIVEINSHYVLTNSKELSDENRRAGRYGKASIDKLLEKAIAIYDYDKLNNNVKRIL